MTVSDVFADGDGSLLYGPLPAHQGTVLLKLVVPGDPLSKQRPRWVRKTGITYTPAPTRHREASIALMARSAMTELAVDTGGLFSLRAGFFVATNQRRDVDNMLKLLSDALTGVVWADDSQVVEIFGYKVHADQPHEARTELLVIRMPGSMPHNYETCAICQRPYRMYPSWKTTKRRRQTCSRRCWLLFVKQQKKS